MNLSIFKKIGLKDKEIKVYLGLLEHGAISVRKIASITRLNRGTVYDILKNLQVIGLVSYYHRATRQKFVAESPSKLLELSEAKEKEFLKTKKEIIELIPELKSLENSSANKPIIKIYEGRSGIKFILKDVLSSLITDNKKEYRVYSTEGIREDVYRAEPEFNQKRIKAGIKVKTISLSAGGGVYGLDARKWVKAKKEKEFKATYILIYANKCALISRDSFGNPIGVIIENQMIYETQKIIFNQLWSLLK